MFKTAIELQTKNNKLERLRTKDKSKVAAMGKALTESKRLARAATIAIDAHESKQEEEAVKASAVLEATKKHFEFAKKVSYCCII